MADIRVEPSKLRLSEGDGSDRTLERVRERFLDKVEVAPSGCWMWTAATNDHGYGQLYYEGRPQKAHRIAWRLFRGLIPDALFVLHSCDTPGCVNVEHLFLGDAYDNHKDMTRKGRARVGVGSRHGMSKLTEPRVRAVLLLLADGVGVSQIATCLGVSMQAICRVRDGESWKHVERTESAEAVA
jgi:hypothetical protein